MLSVRSNTSLFRRESISAKDIADMMFRQKALIAGGVVAILLAVGLYAVLSKPQFKSEMLVLVKNDRPDPVLSDGLNTSQYQPKPDVTEAQIATEVELLSNQDLLLRVVQKCELVPANSDTKSLAIAVRKLEKNLHITPGIRSNLIKITYVADSPKTAVLVLKELMNEYLETHLKMHRAAGSYEFFRDQVNRYQTYLQVSRARLADFESRTKVVVLEEQKDLRLRKLADLEANLQEAITAEREARDKNSAMRTQIAGLSDRVTTQTRRVPNQYSAERLNTMLAELQNRRTEMLVKFQPDDRMVKEVDDQITQTHAALEVARNTESQEQASDINPVRERLVSELLGGESRVRGLQARITSLQADVQSYRQDLTQLGSQTGTYEDLTRAVKEAESRYTFYARQLEEAELASQLDKRRIANLAVVMEPKAPLAPYPKLDAPVIVGAIVSVLIWVVMLVVRALRRRVAFTPWELEGVLAIPVLGTMPLAEPGRLRLVGPEASGRRS